MNEPRVDYMFPIPLYSVSRGEELDLSEKKAREYRIIDNKTSEYANWNDDLYTELRQIGKADLIDFYFDDKYLDKLDKDLGVDFKELEQEDISQAEDKLLHTFQSMREAYDQEPKIIACPHCRKEFQVR